MARPLAALPNSLSLICTGGAYRPVLGGMLRKCRCHSGRAAMLQLVCHRLCSAGQKGRWSCPGLLTQSQGFFLSNSTLCPAFRQVALGDDPNPMGWSCSRYIRFRSWDNTAIPYPFSKVDFFYGEPLQVPPKIKTEAIEEYRVILEDRLNALYKESWALHGKSQH